MSWGGLLHVCTRCVCTARAGRAATQAGTLFPPQRGTRVTCSAPSAISASSVPSASTSSAGWPSPSAPNSLAAAALLAGEVGSRTGALRRVREPRARMQPPLPESSDVSRRVCVRVCAAGGASRHCPAGSRLMLECRTPATCRDRGLRSRPGSDFPPRKQRLAAPNPPRKLWRPVIVLKIARLVRARVSRARLKITRERAGSRHSAGTTYVLDNQVLLVAHPPF